MDDAEILLLGTGERVEMVPAALRQYLNKAGIQVDVMNTVSCSSPPRADILSHTAHAAERMLDVQLAR